jgi:hypothetical protein
MRLNPKTSFLLGYLFVMFLFWWGMYSTDLKFMTINKVWGIGINFIPFFGGVFGLFTAKQWGGLKSAVGRWIIYLSVGLLSWSIGNWIWSYYNFFLDSEIPYPSLADAGYLLAVPLWMMGIFYLSKATGVKYGLKKKVGQLYLIIVPVISFVISYYVLVTVARGGEISTGDEGLLKIFFDFAYPISDMVIVTIALLVYGLSFKYLGGMYKWPVVIILAGFVLMFLADFSFSYETTLETYYDGNAINLLFITALFAMGFGINSLDFREG